MVLHHAANGVVYITSTLIPCTHAFATRLGGVSSLPHTTSLNLGLHRGDDEETVRRNLALFGEAAGFDPGSVISLRQIHSSDVRVVTADDCGLGYFQKSYAACDGYATIDPRVTPGVKTADCVPILLCAAGNDGVPYAVAAIHAGWRGTVAGIAAEGVRKLESLGARTEDIRAVIGPAIGMCCFEISSDVRDEIINRLGSGVSAEFVRPSDSAAGKWYADLKGINRHVLISAGVQPEMIDVSDLCTCCTPELFYSHRRNCDARGTMLSVINLKVSGTGKK